MKNKILFLFTFFSLVGCASIEQLQKKVIAPIQPKRSFSAKWGKNLDPTYLSGNLPIHLNGPAVYEGNIFIGSSGNGFLSIDERDGKIRWKVSENETYHSSPLVSGDSVIYGTESGRIKSRKMTNGELNFEIDLGASVDGNPIVSKGRLFIQLRNHQIFSLDASTGKILWSYKKSVTNKTTIQGVGEGLVDNNSVIFGFADGDLLSFRVETGDIIWERKIGRSADKFMDLNWPMVKFNDALATVDAAGNLYLVRFSDGEIINQFSIGISTNLVLHEDSLYFGDTSGSLHQLDRELKVTELAKFSKRTLSRVGIWNGKIIAGDINGLVSTFSLKELKTLWQKYLGNELSTMFRRPLKGDLGGLIMFTSRGRLYYY